MTDSHSPSHSSKPLTIVFLGTPDFAVPTLQALLDADDMHVAGVMTQPDRPSGRGQKLTPPPVKVLAEHHGLPVQQQVSLRKDEAAQAWLKSFNPDFLVTVAFGQILPQSVLDIPKYGTVNVHASLLPEYRGANPIQWALIHGKTETGITTMLTDIGVDTGDMLEKSIVPITDNDNAVTLADKLARAGAVLLPQTLRKLAAATLQPQPQDHQRATHAPKLAKDDALLDWSQPAETLFHKIRGQQPWPGALSYLEQGPLKILCAEKVSSDVTTPLRNPGAILAIDATGALVQCGNSDMLRLLEVQPAGKKAMSARDWANGAGFMKLPAEALPVLQMEAIQASVH